MVRFALALAAISALSACGGRVADPVSTTRASDNLLTCAHIEAERNVNIARAEDLSGENEFAANNNFGMLVASPLFLDLSDTVQKEIVALDARNGQLDALASAKGCT